VVLLGRRLRIVAVVIAVVVFAAAAVGVVMGVAAGGDPAVRTMDKMWPFKQDPGPDGGPSKGDKRAWVQKYGAGPAWSLPNLPDVAAATPEQRAGAMDLLIATENGTAPYADPKVAAAAGYNFSGGLSGLLQKNPGLAKGIQAFQPNKMVMLHVSNTHPSSTPLNPNEPEDLMYMYNNDGSLMLMGVMYLADAAYPGPPPTPGGPITRWHYHVIAGATQLGMHVFFVPGNDLAQAYAIDMPDM
jgi:hypothetical protein